MFGEFVCLRKIPHRTLGLIVFASTESRRTCVCIDKFFGPLPDIANQVHHAKRTRSLRVRIDRIRSAHNAALVGNWDRTCAPPVYQRIGAATLALRRILPLPLMGQALAVTG